MAAIHLGSDLLETVLTSAELNLAMQFAGTRELSIAYLQNSRVALIRTLATQEFTDPAKDGENQRGRAYLKGQLDLLDSLIYGAMNPTPVSLNEQSAHNPPIESSTSSSVTSLI